MITFKGVTQAQVLAALWNGSRKQGMGLLADSPNHMTDEAAQTILNNMKPNRDGGYCFDYLGGRVLKVTIFSSFVEGEFLYDRDLGQDHCLYILEELMTRPGSLSSSAAHTINDLEKIKRLK